jgi:hypothetical protein
MSDNLERLFRHPHGSFELRIVQRDPDQLCQALLAAGASYILLSADLRNTEDRELALDFVDLADELTNGTTRIAKQRRREEARLQFAETHDELRRRGYSVLSGRVETAVYVPATYDPSDSRIVNLEWTDLINSTAVVIADAGLPDAYMLVPAGHVAPSDKGRIEPTRELGWGD